MWRLKIINIIRVFPKWILLNSANSVTHDKIQKCYGYHSHKFITNGGNTKYICINKSRWIHTAIYYTEQIPTQRWYWKFLFYHYIWKCIYCRIWSISGNHTACGFNECIESHLEKTKLFRFVFVYIIYQDTCTHAIFSYGDDNIINY